MSSSSDDDSYGGGGGTNATRSSTITWNGRQYTFKLKQRRFSVQAKVKHTTNGECVGYLKGYLLPRPSRNFFEFADEASQETQELACIFCESDGVASRVQHPKLTPDAVWGGGFFNIYTVEVKPEWQKADLGLRIVHEALVLLNGRWTLAVMKPAALARSFCHWKSNSRLQDDVGPELSPEQRETCDRDQKIVTRHFARMGFVQAGSKAHEVGAWFLTAQAYFGQHDPVASWLGKTQAKAIEIHEAPKKVQKTGLDKELLDTVRLFPEHPQQSAASLMIGMIGNPIPEDTNAEAQEASIRTMEDLVRRGASVNKSGALQTAAANKKNLIVIKTLLRLGGDINHRDEFGNSPLHVAAACQRHETIEYLLSVGADLTATNSDGDTPLKCLQNAMQGLADFGAAFGFGSMPVREIDVLPKLKCFQAFIPPETRNLLTDGWMSPRMKEMLRITAEFNMDLIFSVDDGCSVQFERGTPTPLSDCCGVSGIWRIDYIPASVFLSPVNSNGLYKSFNDGWGFVWMAIWSVLKNGHAPTVRRVEQYLECPALMDSQYDSRMYRHFLSKGGKVEFAVDALLNITRNVAVDGNDGWEYDTFADDIEALPSTPLDDAFDVARFKCINQGGGEGMMRGPYPETYRLADSSDDESMEAEDEGDY